MPGVLADTSEASFTGQGLPIAVEQLALSGPTLMPRSIKTLSVYTRETFLHSTPNVEAFVGNVLRASVGHTLDVTLLDATAGDAVRPAPWDEWLQAHLHMVCEVVGAESGVYTRELREELKRELDALRVELRKRGLINDDATAEIIDLPDWRRSDAQNH